MSIKTSVLLAGGSTLLTVTLITAGCSDGGSGSPTAPPDPVVTVSPSGSNTGNDRVEFASIDIEKATNGVDADLPPGIILPEGSAITWTYQITNNGNEDLVDIEVFDSEEGVVTCPTSLAAGQSVACTSITGVSGTEAYTNTATVTAQTAGGQEVSDSDDSNYSPGEVAISIDVQKLTNGLDADTAPGPILLATDDPAPTETATWTYFVTNNGAAEITIDSALDDQIGPITCMTTTVAAGQTVECDSESDLAQPHQYENTFSVTASTSGGSPVTVSDRSHYFGALPEISVTKLTDGMEEPTLVPGCPVTWSYEVVNEGNIALESIVLDDDPQGTVTCPFSTLDAGDSMTCTLDGTVGDLDYTNLATVTAEFRIESPNLVQATDEDGYFADPTPTCDFVVPTVTEIWPPNHRLVEVSLVDDACGRDVGLEIMGITQDEPLNDTGDGNTEPDGFILDDDTVELRAERAGTGDGRVYLIAFQIGGESGCQGEVRVDVPHDQSGTPAQDSRPPSYDSVTGDVIP